MSLPGRPRHLYAATGYRFLQHDSSGSFHVGRRERVRGLTQISLLFWSELLPLPGGGALLAGLCLLGPSRGLGTRDLLGQAEESHAKGMRAVHSPAAGLSPRLFLFLLPCRAEAQGGRFSATASETCCRSRTLTWVTPPRGQWAWPRGSSSQVRELRCVVTRKSGLGTPALSLQTCLVTFLCQMRGDQVPGQATLRVK